jgi:hypothetical protein
MNTEAEKAIKNALWAISNFEADRSYAPKAIDAFSAAVNAIIDERFPPVKKQCDCRASALAAKPDAPAEPLAYRDGEDR